MGSNDFISEINGKFSIDRIFNDKKYNFGIFDTYEEALDKLDFLEEEGWPISRDVIEEGAVIDNLGLALNNIEEIDGKFFVFKFINGEKVIFGEYDTIDEAKQVRNNLIDNAWESTEPYTRSKYGKYILKKKNKFIVKRTYNGGNHFFGYFKTLDEAIECREELVSTNWGDLNISLQMKPGKYISYNGIMYTIQRLVDGSINVYGYFYHLDDAIKQRDWLMENNWSRLEVPDDSKRHIHKQGNKYLIYKRRHDDIEYFGTFLTLEEAKRERNRLIVYDWVVDEDTDDMDFEKISDFVYFDGEYYTIEKEVDGQNRIYGVYKTKKQALDDEKSLINYDWDGQYAIPTEEYPYGENIVPFDYIFILEEFEDGIKNEIGRYYSFKEAVLARDEKFGKSIVNLDRLVFSVKIGKSYKNRGWSIIRDTTYDLIPKLPYEDNCDIIVDGIPTTAKLNLLPRIFYTKTDDVVNHLEELAKTNPDGRINVEFLLNKENPLLDSKNKIVHLNKEIKSLNSEIGALKNDIDELKDILEYMDEENKLYLELSNDIHKTIEEVNKIDISHDELYSISDLDLRLKIFTLLDQIKSLKDSLKN